MKITYPRTEYTGDPALHPDWHDIHVNGRYVGCYAKSPDDCDSRMRWTGEVTLDHLVTDEPGTKPALLWASSEAKLRARIRHHITANARHGEKGHA